MITFYQLKSFCQVVSEGSFKAAAEKLYISQPSISQHIANLESYFEVQLFVRRGRKIQLTPEGRYLYASASEILENVENITERFRDIRNLRSGKLVIGTSSFTGTYLLPKAMELFRSQFPMIEISIFTGSYEKILQHLKNDEIELAILGKDLNSSEEHDFIYRAIGFDKLVFVSSESSSTSSNLASLNELDDKTIISFTEGNPISTYFKDLKLRRKLNFKEQIMVEDIEIAKNLTRQGLGICLTSRLSVSEEVKNHRLSILQIDDSENLRWEIRAIYHKTRGLSYAGWEMLKILQKMAGSILD